MIFPNIDITIQHIPNYRYNTLRIYTRNVIIHIQYSAYFHVEDNITETTLWEGWLEGYCETVRL